MLESAPQLDLLICRKKTSNMGIFADLRLAYVERRNGRCCRAELVISSSNEVVVYWVEQCLLHQG